MPEARNYVVWVCSECLREVDLDNDACPQDCFHHPEANVAQMVIQADLPQAKAWMRETIRRDLELAEKIRRGEV